MHARITPIENTPLQKVLLVVVVLLLLSPAAHAQITSVPPLLQGQASNHLWSIPGVINSGGLGTYVSCTNANINPVRVGVEVFKSDGSSANDTSATSLSIPAGGTALFGTSTAAGFVIDSNLLISSLPKGSARVLATAKSHILCTAFVADDTSIPPASMTSLTIVKKVTQKGE